MHEAEMAKKRQAALADQNELQQALIRCDLYYVCVCVRVSDLNVCMYICVCLCVSDLNVCMYVCVCVCLI